MALVKLDQKSHRTGISSFEMDSQIVFHFFNNLPVSDRDSALLKAVQIGVLALKEDRLSAFLAKTTNELGVELENLKMIFDLKHEIFSKSSVKGLIAEDEIASFLNQYFSDRKLKDKAILTGNVAGRIPKNKTGDIICEVDGSDELRIVIEVKFDKSIRLGDISTKEYSTRNIDTVWSQLIEAQANRDAKVSIIVLDESSIDGALQKQIENVAYIPSVGLVAVVNSMSGDYRNLTIAYSLARDIAVNAKTLEIDAELLMNLVKRIVKDLTEINEIRSLIENNINANRKILEKIEKSSVKAEFNREYLLKFLKDGNLTKDDMLSFYRGDGVANRFKQIEDDIASL